MQNHKSQFSKSKPKRYAMWALQRSTTRNFQMKLPNHFSAAESTVLASGKGLPSGAMLRNVHCTGRCDAASNHDGSSTVAIKLPQISVGELS